MPPAYIIVTTQVLANVANATSVADYVEKSIASLPFGSADSLLTVITGGNEGKKQIGRRRKKDPVDIKLCKKGLVPHDRNLPHWLGRWRYANEPKVSGLITAISFLGSGQTSVTMTSLSGINSIG